MARNRKITFIIIGFLFVLNIFAFSVVYYISKPKPFEVIFLSVGQGDAIMIKTSENRQILIDGGPDSTILKKLSKEMPFYDRTLDLVILTHPEKDHLSGLLEVLKRYRVKNILWTGIKRALPEWQEWENLIKKEGAVIEIAKTGEKVIIEAGSSDIYIDVLSPMENLEGQEYKDSNSTSIVFKLVFGNISFLFTGDIGEAEEEKLVIQDNFCQNSCEFASLKSDVLKVSHHGSKNSSSEEFLKKVMPKTAIIEVGNNNYGHPTQEVLARLEKFGIQVLRTDIDGDIRFISGGKSLKINKEK